MMRIVRSVAKILKEAKKVRKRGSQIAISMRKVSKNTLTSTKILTTQRRSTRCLHLFLINKKLTRFNIIFYH